MCGRKRRGIEAKIVADVERAVRCSPFPAAPLTLEALEPIAARIIQASNFPEQADPLSEDERERMVQDLFPGVDRSRQLSQLPREFWIANIDYLLKKSPSLRSEQIAAADWDWFVGPSSPGAEADARTWERWIRNWSTEVAHLSGGAHVLVAFLIGRGRSKRRHAHLLVSFPPGVDAPNHHEARLAWRRILDAPKGRITIRDFDRRKGGIVYMVEHRGPSHVELIVPRVGCPRIGNCKKFGCRVSCVGWRLEDGALAF